MPTFIIHNDEYESGYLEGIQENLSITSQSGFGGIVYRTGLIDGDFQKETVFSGDITFNERNPSGTTARATERLELKENIGVKVSYNTNKQKIPWNDLARSNFDNMAYSNALGVKVAQSEFKHCISLAIQAFIAATTKAGGGLLYTSGGAFDKKDLINILSPLQDNSSKVSGFLSSRALAFDILEEAVVKNRYGEGGVVYGAQAGTFNVPLMASALPALLNGTKSYIFALYDGAIEITADSNAPSVVIRDNDDTENHYQTWSLDGAFNIKLRNMPYIGAGGYVQGSMLSDVNNWDRTASIENLGGSIGLIGA